MLYHLIVNPVAGRGRARSWLPRARDHFETRGLTLRVRFTEAPGHATRLAAALPEDAPVLVMGGDGTLHEVAVACIGTERTLGVLPAGSGDDFAFALGIGRDNPDEALSVILSGHIERVDTGTVNGNPFINSLGIGFDAQVAHTVHLAPAFLKERAAYLYAVFLTLGRLETPFVDVKVDGQPFYRGPALLASTQNGPRTGGSFLFAPGARLDDGRLDLVVAGGIGRRGALDLLPKVIRGRHLGYPEVHLTTGKHFKLDWKVPRLGHMEGELLAASCSFDIRVRPASLKVFAKR